MAKTLYDYWFVQFDFPDKNGKPYKSSGGKMVYDDALNREIPEEWEVRKLGELLHTVLGGTPSTKAKEYWNGDINWLNSGEVANFPIVSSELKITEGAIKKSVKKTIQLKRLTGRSSIKSLLSCAKIKVWQTCYCSSNGIGFHGMLPKRTL